MVTTEPQENPLPLRQIGSEPYFAEEKPGWKGYVEWEVRDLVNACKIRPSSNRP